MTERQKLRRAMDKAHEAYIKAGIKEPFKANDQIPEYHTWVKATLAYYENGDER